MKSLSIFSLASAALVLGGCGSPPDATRYVDSNGPRTIVTTNEINIQDFNNAGNKMVQSLLESGKLPGTTQQPSVLAISRITNDTNQQFDIDMLVKNIRVALSQSGKVVTTTTFGPGGKVEDPMARDAGNMKAFLDGQPAPTRLPDYTLSGKILMNTTKAGSINQTSYVFQLSLTDIKSGLAVWEDQYTITKQGRYPSVGF